MCLCASGLALQIQCYQCEMTHDCSTPEFIVNCTINVQDMCQKEVLVKDDGQSLTPHLQPSLSGVRAFIGPMTADNRFHQIANAVKQQVAASSADI